VELKDRLREAGLEGTTVDYALKQHAAGNSTDLMRLLLIRALWSVVSTGREDDVFSVSEWPQLTENGFPFLDGHAARRLLESGADAGDIDAVIRSAQVLAMYNVANVLDSGGWPETRELLGEELAERLGWAVIVHEPSSLHPLDLRMIHEGFEEADPAGRFGAAPTAAEWTLSRLDEQARTEITEAIEAGDERAAALGWSRSTGSELRDALDAVKELRRLRRQRGE